jgi:hypothetical protein
MEKNAIYFPYMRAPENQWFTQALIYWDQINSIIPVEYASHTSKLGPYTQDLVETGLVRPIIPGEYIDKIPNFVEAFLDLVDSHDYPVPKEISKRKALPTFYIHAQKLGSIGHELFQRGLARPADPMGWDWYEVETFTANQFMAYLAASLGKLNQIKSDPITDSSINLNPFNYEYLHNTNLQLELDKLRTIVLRNLLPTPSESVAPIEIIEFKEDHKRELNRFRDRIEGIIIDAKAINDIALRDLKISQSINETNNMIAEISEAMKSKGWKKVILGELLTYAPPTIGLAAALSTGNPLGSVAAALGLASAAHRKYQEIGRKDAILSQYAAYAVYARKKWGNPTYSS